MAEGTLGLPGEATGQLRCLECRYSRQARAVLGMSPCQPLCAERVGTPLLEEAWRAVWIILPPPPLGWPFSEQPPAGTSWRVNLQTPMKQPERATTDQTHMRRLSMLLGMSPSLQGGQLWAHPLLRDMELVWA